MVAQLPIELLQIIFQDATPESLRTYRLVDRQWCAASTPYAFERFHASLFSRSFTKLSALAQSPLAKHVKAIEFHSDQLPDYTRKEWESKIDLRPSISTFRADLEQDDWSQTLRRYNALPRHDYTPSQLDAGWLAFQTYCREQESWIDGQGGLALNDCLSRFQNLSEAAIGRAKPFGGHRSNNMPFWRNFMGEILVGPDAWTYESSSDNRFEALSALYMVTAIGHRAALTGVKAVEKLMLELPEAFSFYHLVHLPPSSIDVIPEDFHARGFTGADPDEAHHSARYKVIVDVFEPLQHLVLKCPSVVGSDSLDEGAISQAKEAEQFLAAATNLRSLDLDFGEPLSNYEGVDEETNQFDVGLLLLLSDHRPFPLLEDLRISAAFPSGAFNQFLIQHRDTLKRLDIRDCLSDRWDKVLKTIAKDLKLDHIYVEGLWFLTSEDDSDEEDGPSLLLGEGLDAQDEFTRDMKTFLQTGEGSMPVIAEYEMMDFDDDMEDDEDDEFLD